MKKMPPLLLLVLGLLVGYPAARIATAPEEKKATPAESAAAANRSLEGEDCRPEDSQGKKMPPHAWCDPVRVLRDFFGLPPALEIPRGDNLKEVIAAARAADYDLRFMVALVPPPSDPRLDQALEAIQKGFAQAESSRSIPPRSEFLIDRVWFPWTAADAAQERFAQKAPGIMLFRGRDPHSLALVFLVVESSRTGIQKDAFREALELTADLHEASLEPKVSILGPSFSGSVESLRLALLNWRQSRGDLLQFRAASGSTTARGLEDVFDAMSVDFCRAVLPDDVLHERAFDFLRHEMGWDLGKVALLTEADTAYGQKFLETETQEQKER